MKLSKNYMTKLRKFTPSLLRKSPNYLISNFVRWVALVHPARTTKEILEQLITVAGTTTRDDVKHVYVHSSSGRTTDMPVDEFYNITFNTVMIGDTQNKLVNAFVWNARVQGHGFYWTFANPQEVPPLFPPRFFSHLHANSWKLR